jgi:hypothetical protein
MPRIKTNRPVGAPKSMDEFVSGAQTHSKPPASNPLNNLDPKAPRKYKAVAIQFNKYEFDRLDAAVNVSDMGKNEFIRSAIEAACKRLLK